MTDTKFEDVIKEAKSEIVAISEQYNEAKKKMADKLQVVFNESFKQFWKDNPNIAAIAWEQYTPYFNDGDACIFRVGDLYAMSKDGYEKYKDEGGYPEEYSLYHGDDDLQGNATEEDIDKANKFMDDLAKIPDEVYEAMFGDHARVVATPEGFDVQEFEHD